MSHNLWNLHFNTFSLHDERVNSQSATAAEFIHQHGLSTTITSELSLDASGDFQAAIGVLGGAESEANLYTLTQWINNLRTFATYLTLSRFRHEATTLLPQGRSLDSALRNMQSGVYSMLVVLRNFLGKDIKLPTRYLTIEQTNTDYGYDPEDVTYSESETGTYHTLQTLGENQTWNVWSCHLEDCPVVRRYLRYVDSIAKRYGMRLVYCPKQVNTFEELGSVQRPAWSLQGGTIRRVTREARFKALFVSFAFDYDTFKNLTFVETEVQPGQPPRPANSMDYSPILVDNLQSIAKVITTFGSFAPCKIYYKDYQTSARSQPAGQPS